MPDPDRVIPGVEADAIYVDEAGQTHIVEWKGWGGYATAESPERRTTRLRHGEARQCRDCPAEILMHRRRCIRCVIARLNDIGKPRLSQLIEEYSAGGLRMVTPNASSFYFAGGDHAVTLLLGEGKL